MKKVFAISLVDWATEQAELTRVRFKVFVDEQGVPPEIELDELDASCIHAAARDAAGEVMGTARLILTEQPARIGRMAVLPQWRGHGVGAALLGKLIDEARLQGATAITLHAQIQAAPFYAKQGFVPYGNAFEEAGIAHQEMILEISVGRM